MSPSSTPAPTSRFLLLMGYAASNHLAFLIFATLMALIIACVGGPEETIDRACPGLEAVTERAGLISWSEAEEFATERLRMSAPEVTGVEVERVWSSCLTTFRSYEQDLLSGRGWSNPELWSPDMPVWVVEVKSISRPAGISASNADNPYSFAMDVMDARSGEFIAGSRYEEPLLASGSNQLS